MGLADICNLGLGLGVGPQKSCMKTDHQELSQKKKQQYQDPLKCIITENKLYPSLSLGPPADDEAYQVAATKVESADFHAQASSDPSAVSSFSNSSSIKRERDQFVGDEADHELEVDKFPSRNNISDLDEDGNPRKKLRLTKEQSALLEDSFKEHSTLNPKQKQELAMKLKLRARQVEVWFQNRRARTKLKQTEVDCELLKKCCETLTEENKRLQKELQELKSAPASFFMQLPAATLTICPSCERICSGATAGNGSTPAATAPFFIGSKVHNFHGSNYSFTHPPAAC